MHNTQLKAVRLDGLGLGSTIYLTGQQTATLDLRCKYKADFSASSDSVEIYYDQIIRGTLSQQGSWEGSFTGNLLNILSTMIFPNFELILTLSELEIYR